MNKIDLKNIEMIDALASRRNCSQGGIDYYRKGAMDMATQKDFLFSKAIINARNPFDFPLNDMCKELVDNVINTIKYAYYDLIEETNKL